MRRVKITNIDGSIFMNYNFIGEGTKYFVCETMDGNQTGSFHKNRYTLTFLDPPEEEKSETVLLTKQLRELEQRVEKLENKKSGNSESLDSIYSRQNDMEHKFDGLENEVGRVSEKLNTYRALGREILKQHGLSDLIERVDKLEDEVHNEVQCMINKLDTRTLETDKRINKREDK